MYPLRHLLCLPALPPLRSRYFPKGIHLVRRLLPLAPLPYGGLTAALLLLSLEGSISRENRIERSYKGWPPSPRVRVLLRRM